jgi:hypothetical protein
MVSSFRTPVANPIEDALFLYGDVLRVSSSETPLVMAEAPMLETAMIVHPNVIRKYQRMIFELQSQVVKYRVLLDNLGRRPAIVEEFVPELSTPIGESSIRMLDAIFNAKIPDASILRAYDEPEQ